MAIEFNCPHCEHAYRLKDELAGKTATCKTCRNKINIPQPVTVPDDPPRLTAEQIAEADAKALAALADEQVQSDAAEQVIPVECPHCNHKWTEPLARAGKNALCPNPECRQRVKIPEPKKDQIQDWRIKQTNLPSGAKQNFEKLEGVVDAGATQGVSGGTIRELIAPEELEPRSLKRMAMFGFVILALVGGLVYGVVSLLTTRTEGKENRLIEESLEEYARTVGSLPANEAPAEAQVCSAVLSIAAGEHAVRHKGDPKKLQEAIEHFAKARDSLRKAPAGPARNAVVGELAVALLVLGGDDQQIRDQLRIRWTPESTIRPRLNERVYTVHEELRQTFTLLQGTEFEFKNHFARRLTRALTKLGQSGLAVDLIPLTLFAPSEQDEGKAVVALEVYRIEKDSALVRKVLDELKARGGALAASSPPPSSAQTLFLALDGDKPRQFILPPASNPVPEHARFAYVGKHLLDGQSDEALKLAQRGGTADGQVRALVLCADWGADPVPALDAAFGLVKANEKSKALISPYSVLRLAQISAEKGRHDQAKEIAKLIPDDGLRAWALGTAAQLRSLAAPNEKADDTWVEIPPTEKLPKDLRAGHAWGRLWVARHNTRLSGSRTGEVKAVSAWPAAVALFGRAGVALGLQDRDK